VILALLQQNPIVFEVAKQPPATPEISYASVLLSAVGLVGVILLASAIVGLAVGGFIILVKKHRGASTPTDPDPGHALRI
jgi:hypothetical protein